MHASTCHLKLVVGKQETAALSGSSVKFWSYWTRFRLRKKTVFNRNKAEKAGGVGVLQLFSRGWVGPICKSPSMLIRGVGGQNTSDVWIYCIIIHVLYSFVSVCEWKWDGHMWGWELKIVVINLLIFIQQMLLLPFLSIRFSQHLDTRLESREKPIKQPLLWHWFFFSITSFLLLI